MHRLYVVKGEFLMCVTEDTVGFLYYITLVMGDWIIVEHQWNETDREKPEY